MILCMYLVRELGVCVGGELAVVCVKTGGAMAKRRCSERAWECNARWYGKRVKGWGRRQAEEMHMRMRVCDV